MSSRIQKAREIRAAARRKRGQNPYQDAALEVGLSATIFVICCLFGLGAGIATIYIKMHSPGCMTAGAAAGVRGAETIVAPKEVAASVPAPKPVPVPVPAAVVPQPVPVPAAPATGVCTADQMATIKKQLTPDTCRGAAYTQECSFTVASKKSGCIDTTSYFRQPMASISLKEGFAAVLIGTESKDDTPMDALAIGSHDPNKYKLEKWHGAAGAPVCKRPDVTFSGGVQKAQVFILEEDGMKAMAAKQWKTQSGLTDDDLKGSTTTIALSGNNAKTLTSWAKEEISTQYIHYLKIYGANRDYEILTSGAGVGEALEARVWYLEFGYNWRGQWEGKSMKKLITETLSPFACYWQGANGNLWRISGCWQDHYEFKSWADLVCVNTKIEYAKPIYEKMEQAFQETLKKDHQF